MKSLTRLRILILLGLPSTTSLAGPIFVIDVDYVLVEGVDASVSKLPPERVISNLGGEKLLVTQYAGEFIAQLASIPDAEVYIFSDSPLDRIKHVLSQIRVDGRTPLMNFIKDIYSEQDVKVYDERGLDRLVQIYTRQTREPFDSSYFKGYRKKDMGLFGSLNDVILIDDTPGNMLPGQEKNLLRIPFDTSHAKDFEMNGKAYRMNLSEKFGELKKGYLYWNKLAIASATINASYEEWVTNPFIPFRDIVFKRTYEVSSNGKIIGERYFHKNPDIGRAIATSVRRFYQINPSMKFQSLLGVWPRDCRGYMKDLFKEFD